MSRKLVVIALFIVDMPEKPENSTAEQAGNQNSQPEARELTLTDKLNKRLLTSFLERINSTDTFNQSASSSSANGNSVDEDNDFDE